MPKTLCGRWSLEVRYTQRADIIPAQRVMEEQERWGREGRMDVESRGGTRGLPSTGALEGRCADG